MVGNGDSVGVSVTPGVKVGGRVGGGVNVPVGICVGVGVNVPVGMGVRLSVAVGVAVTSVPVRITRSAGPPQENSSQVPAKSLNWTPKLRRSPAVPSKSRYSETWLFGSTV